MVHDFPKQWLLWSRWWIVFRSKRKKGECVCLFDPTVWPLIYHLQKLRQLNASWTLAFSGVSIFFARDITVETLIRAAALNFFHVFFGKNLLSKNLSYLRLLFKGGSYLSAALINVITVFGFLYQFLGSYFRC